VSGPLLASAHRALEQAMAEVPQGAGVDGALVFGATTDGVVSMGLAVRDGDDWSVEGQLAVDITAGKVRDVAGAVRAVWRF
jgi:hypothetical protein